MTLWILMSKRQKAKGYLSYSHSQEEDDEEAKYIVEHYGGNADDYAMEDESVVEYFASRLDYAFTDTMNSISPMDYEDVIESASKEYNNQEIELAIENIHGKEDMADAVSDIVNAITPEYDSELGEYYIDFLQEHVDDYLRRQ